MTDDHREELCAMPVPTIMSTALEGYHWARDNVGASGSAVYRLHGKPTAPDLFLKQGLDAIADEVTDEMERLRWLADHIPVPAIVHVVRTPSEAWLLMTAMPGKTAYQVLEANADTGVEIVDALARFLRQLHAVPVDACPFNSAHAFRLTRAQARMEVGLIATDDFDEEREGWTAEEVWEAMNALLPLEPDPVVTHGDFSLDNILIHEGKVVGCIDVGRAGIADRYQDLAVLWNCLGEFSPLLQTRLFDRYGLDEPDERIHRVVRGDGGCGL